MDIPVEGLEDGVTSCEDAVVEAATLDETSDMCGLYQFFEALCCPSAASTCSICKGTRLLDDIIVPGTDGGSCAQLAIFVAKYDITSENCTDIQDWEAFCCPDAVTVSATTCYLCGEEGVGSFDDVEIPDQNGVTCGQTALWAVSYEVGSENCATAQMVEEFCCPDAATPISSTESPTSPPISR